MIDAQLRSNGLPNISFVPIEPVDKFIMGKNISGSEKIHTTTVPHYFEIAQTVITNMQFQAFIEDTTEGYNNHEWWNFSNEAREWKRQNQKWLSSPHSGISYPRVNITWYEAVAFCKWLSYKLAERFRLPTEAEWELVTRGTKGLLYPWGEKPILKKCNSRESKIGTTCPVGIYDSGDYPFPNIYDLIGNVFEWSLTRWEGAYPFSWKDYRNSIDGDYSRVLRGGSFRYSINDVDATTRVPLIPNRRTDDVGFRIARVLSMTPF